MGAPLNPVPQVLRCFVEGYVDNTNTDKWGNVLYFHYSGGPPSSGDLVAIATHFANDWVTNMAPECPSPTTLRTITLTDLTSTSSAEGEWTGTHAGTRGDDSIPANAAVLISYPSSTRYKGGHPRHYLYCLGNSDLTGATEWTAYAEVQTHWQAYLTANLTASSGSTSLTSFGFVRYHGKFLPNGGPPLYYLNTPIYSVLAVGSATAHAQMASQRRRIGRRKA